ncbi:hypothetical protein F2P56_033926 [Juglans regia]|uniref:Uncharacterized protein n=1 Tax=Juglans regia TaxID=51240 RepID=A0A833TD06_JUGRE|nr:hypothetical protein F2P56_033926 [Juglans regia]
MTDATDPVVVILFTAAPLPPGEPVGDSVGGLPIEVVGTVGELVGTFAGGDDVRGAGGELAGALAGALVVVGAGAEAGGDMVGEDVGVKVRGGGEAVGEEAGGDLVGAAPGA